MASITIHIPSSSSTLFFFLFFFFLFFFFLYIFFQVPKNNSKMASTTTHTPSSSSSSSSSSPSSSSLLLSSSSSSSSNSNSSYDVFLSFRGEDTRYAFTDHLYRALIRNGINTFRDKEGLDRGTEIAPELLKAIEESKVSIVVFSENYAHSKWCLEELAKIMDCNKERNQTVIPIFYHVDPSEQLRKQKGSYGKAFALHQKGADEEKRKMIQKWKTALSEAANLAGHHVVKNEYESEPIEKIIDLILKNLTSKLMSLEELIVGMDSRMKELKLLLNTNTIVGIYGTGGMGKTTTAKIFYNDIIFEFDGASFLQNVREEFKKGRQLQLQQQLLCDTMRRDITLRTINDGINLIKDIFRSKKVLIVVDDVDNSNQLESLIGSLEWFGPGSRVIITTRDQQVISKYKANATSYEIKGLNYHDAFQLFCQHAFQQNNPKENYENLSKCIVNYTKGLPLAIKVLGSFLRDKTIDEWKSEFNKLKKNPKEDIDNVLRRSFEGLDNIEKKVFLDIACFFKGEGKDSISEILDNCGLFGNIGINSLLNKCLITISDRGTIHMHDLVQQMGWAIVCEENSNPYKGTRLWDPDDIQNAFFEKKGIENIEAISCDLSRINDIEMSRQDLKKMKKLRLLKVYWSGRRDTLILPKNFEFSSQKLRYLYWEAYPLKTLPSNFEGENLVELHLPHNNVKQLWSGSKVLGKLKVINLSYSKKLVKLSKFWTMPNVERLNLEGCPSLRELDSSIGCLKKLIFLDLGWCTKLRDLPSSIDALQSLEFLFINSCENLEKFPKMGGNMRRLRELDLRGSGIKELPTNTQCLTSLEVLMLSPYPSLCKFHDIRLRNIKGSRKSSPLGKSIKYLASVEDLESEDRHRTSARTLLTESLQGSSGIKEVPNSIEYLTSLEVLSLNGCQNFETFPEIHGNIGCLRELDLGLTGIKQLPSSFKYLTSLEYLNLSYCSNFVKFPEIFGNMRLLRKLRLDESGIKELPRSFGGLVSLEILSLRNCSNFEIFPEIQGNMKSLRHLYLSTTAIKQLPRSIDCLESLETLDLNGCVNLEKFPEIQKNMGNVRCLCLDRTALKELPSSINHLTGLEELSLKDLENLRSLPSSICDLTCLKNLEVGNCSNLQKLPDILGSLQCSLKALDVSGCKLAEGEIPSNIWSLYSLKYLNISRNDIKSIPAGIAQLSKLESLRVDGCKLLKEITELPSSLRRIRAGGCPCLETSVSNPSSKLWSSLINCFKSRTEEARRYPYGDNPWQDFHIGLPENNGIPEWVRHKNIGGDLTIDLPPNWYNDINFLGFAFFFHSNGPPYKKRSHLISCQLTISGCDQFKKVASFTTPLGLFYPPLAVKYVPKIAISEYHPSHKWRKLKAYLAFSHYKVRRHPLGIYLDGDWKSYEETFPGTYKRKFCGILPIYAEFHQQTEKHFLHPLGENENTSRNAKRSPREAENPRRQEPHHHKRSTLL